MNSEPGDNLDSKYQKLSLEFAKLRNQIPTLKEALDEEKKTSKRLQDEIKTLNIELRKTRSENESLYFRNQQLLRRTEALQENLDSTTAAFAQAKAKKKHKETNLRLFGPAQLGASTSSDMPQTDARMVLEQELERKLAENADLHTRLFDLENQHETVVVEFTAVVHKLEADNKKLREALAERSRGNEDCEVDLELSNGSVAEDERKEITGQVLTDCQKAVNGLSQFFAHIDARSTIYPCDSTLESVPEEIHLFGLECGKLATDLGDVGSDLATLQLFVSEGESIGDVKRKLMEIREKLGSVFENALKEILVFFVACQRKECDAPWCNSHLDELNGQYERLFQQAFQRLKQVLLSSDSDLSVLSILIDLKKVFHRLRDCFVKKAFIESHLPTASKKLKNLNESIDKSLHSVVNAFGRLQSQLEDGNIASWFELDVPVSAKISLANGKKMSSVERQASVIEESNTRISELKAILHKTRTDYEECQQKLHTVTTDVEVKSHRVEDLETQVKVLERQMEVLKGSCEDVNKLRSGIEKGRLLDDYRVVEYYFLEELNKTVTEMQRAQGKIVRYRRDIDDLTVLLQKMDLEFNEHDRTIREKDDEISALKKEMETTRACYEEQLQVMSEHLASLNAKIVHQSDQISTMNGASSSTSTSSIKDNLRKIVRK